MSDAAVPSTEQVQSYLAQHSLEAVIEDAVNECGGKTVFLGFVFALFPWFSVLARL